MLEARSLRKAVVPEILIEYPTPANLQSNRLSLHLNADDSSSCTAYIASGCSVYSLQISMEDSFVGRGKESLLIPEQTHVIDSSLLNRCPHRSEIQSIVLTETESDDYLMLGSVDSFGHLIVSKLDTSGKDVDRITYSVSPEDFGVGEGCWSGLCFSPSQWSMAAVANSFGKSINVYDQDIHLRTFRALSYPTSLSFISSLSSGNETSILAVTEGCQMAIWDLRIKENGGCVQRVTVSVGDTLYAVCNSSNGNIAIGGADRTVTIFDPRRSVIYEKSGWGRILASIACPACSIQPSWETDDDVWSPLSRWINCTKYEITGLTFSSVDPDYIYVQGVDYEVFCGQWMTSHKAFSFRGDSNWLGFSKCAKNDVLGGWCDSGSIFVADVVKGDGTQPTEVEHLSNDTLVASDFF